MENSNQLRQDQIQFTCEICEKDFKNRNGLKHHLNMAHNVAKGYQCNICEKVFNIQSIIIYVESWGMICKNYSALP